MKKKIVGVVLLIASLLFVPSGAAAIGSTGEEAEVPVQSVAEVDMMSQLDSIMLLVHDIAQLYDLKVTLERDEGVLLVRSIDGFEVKLDVTPDEMKSIDDKIKELIQKLKFQVSALK